MLVIDEIQQYWTKENFSRWGGDEGRYDIGEIEQILPSPLQDKFAFLCCSPISKALYTILKDLYPSGCVYYSTRLKNYFVDWFAVCNCGYDVVMEILVQVEMADGKVATW